MIGLLFLDSRATATQPEVREEVVAEAVVATTTVEVAPEANTAGTTVPVVMPPNEVAKKLVDYLGSGHPLYEVARCESAYRQFNQDGSVLRGRQNPQDVGVLQINEKYHLAESIRLGYDIYTLEGNLDYGLYLYNNQGLTPWNWSRHCWQ